MEDFDRDLVDDVVTAYSQGPSRQAITSIDDNPDEAAKALQLSRATGVPAEVVHSDLEGFQTRLKGSVVGDIIRANPQIQEYIRSNPLAEKVSNDDWDNIHEFYKSVPSENWFDEVSPIAKFPGEVATRAAKGILQGLTGPFDFEKNPIRPEDIRTLNDLPEAVQPVAKFTYLNTIDLGRRVIDAIMGAPIEGMKGAIEGAVVGLGGSESDATSAGREFGGIIESEMARMGEASATHAAGEFAQQAREANISGMVSAMEIAGPWIKDGVEPPSYLHPDIDQAKAIINGTIVDGLNANKQKAERLFTKIRDPKSAEIIARQAYGNATIEVNADWIRSLYGDRMPELNDGLFGWVPDLAAQLEAGDYNGVHIPIAGIMAHLDPAIAKDMWEYSRIWPGGITKAEATEIVEPKPVVDSPLAQARAASGTEPMFAIGDRKLTFANQEISSDGYFHSFDILDEYGSRVGDMTISFKPEEKTIYVEDIGGRAGLHSNSFGPSLIRDLKKQLKAIYPEYETITGHRVSGAREKAGTWESEIAYPKVKLSTEGYFDFSDIKNFQRLLEQKGFEHFGQGIYAYPLSMEKMTPEMVERGNIIAEEIERMTAGRADYGIVGQIVYDNNPGLKMQGVYIPSTQAMLVNLFNPGGLGVAHHETIHWMRKNRVFTPEEWAVLENAAVKENWLDQFGINDRYGHLEWGAKLEESIAEAFRDWAAGREVTPEVKTIFEKLMQLWENIKARFVEKGIDPNSIFEQVFSGELAQREIGEGEAGAPKFSIEDANERMNNLRANALGIDSKTKRNLDKRLQERFAKDLEVARKRAEKIQKRVQSAEWKAEAAKIRDKVKEDIHARPDIAADQFIGQGTIGDQKLKQVIPLRSSDLTPEQQKALPRRYRSEDGLPVDSVANLFGFTSGDTMVEALVKLHQTYPEEMSVRERIDRIVNDEVAKQMRLKFGELDKNIMREAEDQALSETDVNIAIEEYQGAAMQAGASVIDKDLMHEEAERIFNNQKVGTIDSRSTLTKALREATNAFKDMTNGDVVTAVQRLQRRAMMVVWAAKAKQLEKSKAAAIKLAKSYAKRDLSDRIELDYAEPIHQVIAQAGIKVARTVEDLAKEWKARGTNNLKDFVEGRAKWAADIEVWDQLFDPNWHKDIDDMTVEEFNAWRDSLQSLINNARFEGKVYRAGEAADFKDKKADMIGTLESDRFKEIDYNTPAGDIRKKGLFKGRTGKHIMEYLTQNVQLFTWLTRWDDYDPNGVWSQWLMRGLNEGAVDYMNLQDQYGKKLSDTAKEFKIKAKNMRKSIDNPYFHNPENPSELIPLTRANAIVIALNTGTKSGRIKMFNGYGINVNVGMAWLNEILTENEWHFVQRIWDIFAETKAAHDTMRRSIGGMPVKSLGVVPVVNKYGTFPGGYFPVKPHKGFVQASEKLRGLDPLADEGFFGIVPNPSFTKDRTGWVGPVALELDGLPGMLNQVLLDTAMRPAIINAAKFFKDKDIQLAIKKYAGAEVKDSLIPYLRNLMNYANMQEKNLRGLLGVVEYFRLNTVMNLIGLNIGTVVKHFTTAHVTSMREAGPWNYTKAFMSTWLADAPTGFANAVYDLMGRSDQITETNYQMAMRKSALLRSRDRHWEETAYGAVHEFAPVNATMSRFIPFREKVRRYSTLPVALSDLVSAVPTWVAVYKDELRKGSTEGDAVAAADHAVRRAHGSMDIATQTAAQRNWSRWFTSIFNFWSNMMNRQLETYWRAGEVAGKVKREGLKSALKAMSPVIAGMFVYGVWPAITHHLASGEEVKEDEPLWKTYGKAELNTLTAGWAGLRDFANFLLYGYSPAMGLYTATMHQGLDWITDLKKDHPTDRRNLGKLLRDGSTFIGLMSGLPGQEVGRGLEYAHGVSSGLENPKGPWGWLAGLRFGTNKGHSATFRDWTNNRVQQ